MDVLKVSPVKGSFAFLVVDGKRTTTTGRGPAFGPPASRKGTTATFLSFDVEGYGPGLAGPCRVRVEMTYDEAHALVASLFDILARADGAK